MRALWIWLPRSALGAALALASLACTPGERSRPATPPNVVLVTIDTLRADHLGCYGYDRDTSPNLDRLAADGVRFANAVSVSSWTLPAHASILTGLYPAEHGVVTDVSALPPSARTLAGDVCPRAQRLGLRTLILPLALDDAFRLSCD